MVLSLGVVEEHERSVPSKTSKSKEPQMCDPVDDGASVRVRGSPQSQPFETAGAAIV
jgi:hypothetical protein